MTKIDLDVITNGLSEQILTEIATIHKHKFAEVNVFCPATLVNLAEIDQQERVRPYVLPAKLCMSRKTII
jgi:hypothetical protein